MRRGALTEHKISIRVGAVTADAPRICCLDLDTFFVSVERVLDSSLEGKPVIVGGMPGQRGVVTACSYEVRALGVRSGMSLTEAARLAPDAIYVAGRNREYGRYSARVVAIAHTFSPLVRTASIDELFMDFRGCERLYHRAGDAGADATILRVVREMTARIAAEVPLTYGVALRPRRRLAARGITTLGEIAAAPVSALEPIFGAYASGVRERARGGGDSDMGRDRPAFREHDPSVAPSASERDLLPVLKALYREARQRKRAVRLLGAALSNLVLDEQLDLFPRDRELRASVDALHERFGFDAVRLGASLK